ncbi:MAG: hypothetical protein QOH91_2605, partial [Mycobacterium sp.]|nr:hypothetical protein [Mycobacterium sp.]
RLEDVRPKLALPERQIAFTEHLVV